MDVQGKHILVVGLARSGLAVAHALARRGAVVTVTDPKPPAEFREVLPKLLKDKVGLELGLQREETFLRHEAIVISPGVPWDLPQLQAARRRRIPIYPEVEVATWFLKGTLVGVTGSNGKTTTTTLLGHMLEASGFPTFVGGNIGNALSSAVDRTQPGTKFVTELSSFQLEGIHEFHPHVAVMLNLSPNHLDRHANLEAYSQAKRQIFRNQGEQDYAVLNADDPWVAGLRSEVPSRHVLFSRRRELASGVFVSGGKIYYRVRHLERMLFETRDVTLRGDFNLEDVLAATTAACLLGADFTAIRRAVREFKAVEHRLEFVQEIQGVDFYNNSKATSVDATVKSLEAFERGVHLIMGGKDKGAPYYPLLPLLKGRVREVLLIGAAAPLIAGQLAGSTELVQAGALSTAVYEAFARSRPGDTVLLAPACSSFDQFKDYEERGRVFKELVKKLANDVAAGAVVRRKLADAQESGARSQESEARSQRSGIRNLESGIHAQELKAQPPPGRRNLTSIDPAVEPALTVAEVPLEGGIARPTSSDRIGPDRPEATTTSEAATSAPAPEVSKGGSSAAAPQTKAARSAPTWIDLDLTEMAISAAAPEVSARDEGGSSAAALQAEVPSSAPAPEVSHPDEGGSSAAALQGASRISMDSAEPPAPGIPAVKSPAEEPQQPEPVVLAETADSAVSTESAAPAPIPAAEPAAIDLPERTEGQAEPPRPAAEPERVSEPQPEEKGSVPAAAHELAFEPEPEEKASVPAAAHHIELRYVFEVDAVELPELESQVVPEDEPSISISASNLETFDEETLPYEARMKKSEVRGPESEVQSAQSEVRSPKSEGQSTESEAPPAPRQPRLPGVE